MTLFELITRWITSDAPTAHSIIHGDASTTVTTEGGPVRSLAKMIADSAAYIAEIAGFKYEAADYTALRAYSGILKSVLVLKKGIAGQFVRDDTDTTSADNGGTIIVDASGRRWRRAFNGHVSVMWWGATGLGVTDDAPAINAAIAANAGRTIYFPSGVYRVSGVLVSTNVNLLGDAAGGSYILIGAFAAVDADAVRYTFTTEARNLFIRNLTIGNFGSSVGRSGHGLNVSNAPMLNFTVENCNIGAVGETGWGIYSSSRGFGGGTIHNCTIPGNIYLRQSTDGLVISKCTIFGGKGYGIDIEIEVGSYCTAIRDSLIVCKDGALNLRAGSQVLIENNQFEQPSGTVNSTPLSSHVVISGVSGDVNRTRNITFRRNNFGGGTGIGRDMWIFNCASVTLQENRFNRGSGAHLAIDASASNTRLIANQYDVSGVAITLDSQMTIADGSSTTIYSERYKTIIPFGDGSQKWFGGAGSPEGVVAANPGSHYTRRDGSADGTNTLYVKASGTGNTGWIAK